MIWLVLFLLIPGDVSGGYSWTDQKTTYKLDSTIILAKTPRPGGYMTELYFEGRRVGLGSAVRSGPFGLTLYWRTQPLPQQWSWDARSQLWRNGFQCLEKQ